MKRINITNNLYYCREKHAFWNKENAVLRLTYSQGKLFELIVRHGQQHPVSKELLIQTIWGKSALFDFSAAINQKIYTLRKELKSINLEGLIITIPRLGYKVNSDFTISETNGPGLSVGFWRVLLRLFYISAIKK